MPSPGPDLGIRAAAILFWVMPIGFTVSSVPVALHLLRTGSLPVIFGIPLFGGGFLERVGTTLFISLLLAFDVVCACEVLAGILLWNGERSGGVLGFAMLPVAAIFWIGFALPLPPLNAAVRTALVFLNWGGLR